MRLADTSFWVALAASHDTHHDQPLALWTDERRPVVVTNHLAGEIWTFLRRRAGHLAAVTAVEVLRSRRVQLVHVDESVEQDAWRWLERHDEREYSFVDATSFMLMRRLRIREALAFDGDFTAAGFVECRT